MNTRTTPVWTTQPEKGSVWLIRLMLWASLFFGRRLTRPVVYLIALFYLCCAPAARRASRDYLRKVLAHPLRWRDLYQHFLYFATVTHDRLYLLAGRFDHFEFEVSGKNAVAEALQQGRGALFYGAHFGSFEAVKYDARHYPGLKLSMLMFEHNGRKLIDALRKISPDFAESIIPLGSLNSMLTVRERLVQGHAVGLLADRSLHDERGRTVDFLGAPASFPQAPFRLQKLYRCPALFMAGVYLGGNRYRLEFAALSGDNDVALQADYVTTLAALCQRDPFNWFNFYDFWKR